MSRNYDPDPYPIRSFPDELARVVEEVKNLTMTPGALPAMSVLTALSVSCQGLVDVRLPLAGEVIRPVSLNLLFVGESGERRSSVDALVCAPIYAHDEQATKDHEAAMSACAQRRQIWLSVKKGLVRQITKAQLAGEPTDATMARIDAHNAQEVKAPRLRRYIRQNSTTRATFESLQGDGESIAFMTDEGQILLDSSTMRTLGLGNKLWDGARVLTLDRAEHDNIVVLNPRATFSIMTHEAVLKRYLKKHGDIASGSGHWARYLIAYPTSMKGFRLDWRSHSTEPVELPWLHGRIRDLLKIYSDRRQDGTVKRDVLVFDEKAALYWKDLARKVEIELGPGLRLRDISDFASKYMEILSRLAALFHYFCGMKGNEISKSTLEAAQSIAVWHLRQYKRLLGDGPPATEQDAYDLLDYLLIHHWNIGSTRVHPTELLHNGPAQLRTRWRRDATLKTLESWGAIQIEYEDPERKKGPRIVLNGAYFQNGYAPAAA
ncbi:YfjI family protein [Stenotrophomonas maltophilia]|uniref:YfjI family protein n=1 Tax=Stenotrophomonas maltophilia TaxID=40324 RepID=UPI00313C94F0